MEGNNKTIMFFEECNLCNACKECFHDGRVDYDVIYPYKPTSANLDFKNFVEY